jgi:outer membrane protein assembly factor BamD
MMHLPLTKLAALGALLALIAMLSGCSSSEQTEQLSAEKRYAVGMRLFKDGNYLDAIEEFKIVTLQYQGSTLADAAQYYLAECRFLREEFILAAFEYETLLRTMPTSIYVAKARYKRAFCHYLLSPASYLDQKYTREAIDDFQTFIEYHPTDSLVTDAEQKIMELNTKLAKKEYEDGITYMKQDYYRSAIVYFDAVLDKYHDTPYAEMAQLKKAESLSMRKKQTEAMQEIDLFYKKYPNSQHKEEADRILTDIRARIAEEKETNAKIQKKKEENVKKADQLN